MGLGPEARAFSSGRSRGGSIFSGLSVEFRTAQRIEPWIRHRPFRQRADGLFLVYNSGAEQSAEEEELSGEAFLQRDDRERYVMYVYPVEQTVEDGIFR
jgi:hypothetical protein